MTKITVVLLSALLATSAVAGPMGGGNGGNPMDGANPGGGGGNPAEGNPMGGKRR